MILSAEDRADLDLVAAWLARVDPEPDRVDVVVVLGSSVLETLDVAEHWMRTGRAGRLVVSGGVGHSTHLLEARTGRTGSEAEILGGLLRERGIDAELETESTNCGDNARRTAPLLRGVGTALLVQDPTMQRRTHACFEREAPWVSYASAAPFVPTTTDRRGAWDEERFARLVVGEVDRLRDDEHGYGPRGADFIDHVDVPAAVDEAARKLQWRHDDLGRPR